MARDITINRDEAELLVDLLEENYKLGSDGPHYLHAGTGADLAFHIRELFGMAPQPDLQANSK